MSPWGYKLTVQVYLEGPPDSDTVTDAIEAVNRAVPSAYFVGASTDLVEGRPLDEGPGR